MPLMPLITTTYGELLIVVAVVAYVLTSAPTALIPAGFGILFVALGVIGWKLPDWRKHAMHIACVLALLALLGTAPGLFKLPALIVGNEVARPAAVVSQSIVAILSVIFLAFCIRSFILARRARAGENRVQ